ncbi:MAG: hypothetical protein NO475_03675 [Candidatus Methanomethylicia archaeon]|nr:hypothetical protein [Candidatus Methanomethylicia archaeon]
MFSTIDYEKELENIIEEKVNDLLWHYVRLVNRILITHIHGTQSYVMKKFGLPVEIEVSSSYFEYGSEIRVRTYLSQEIIDYIRKRVKKEIKENYTATQIRTKALRNILTKELKSSSGGINAILPDNNRSSSESANQTGGAGEEVQHEEGGHSSEGSNESNL